MTAAGGLVERHAQLAALEHLIGSDGGAVALIEGEAGAGKSALLAQALASVPNGTAVWAGRCEPLAVPAPFSALFEMLPRLPLELAESVRNGADPISVYSAMLAAMQRRPIVLVLDDLQWADATTAGLARYVGRRLDGTPSTLLCAFRNDELDPSREAADALAELARVSTRIGLSPLSVQGIAILASRLAPDRSIDPTAVHRATGGNPLFVVETLRNVTGVLPSSVADIVVAQVRRLPIATQQLVEMIALCPDGLAIDTALTLSPEAAEHVDIACAAARPCGLPRSCDVPP